MDSTVPIDYFSTASIEPHQLARRSVEAITSLVRAFPLSTLAIAGLLAVVCVIVYRLTLHPLAKYPGPFLGRVSSWYNVYHAFKGDKHIQFHLLHQRYGTFVRYSPNAISVNDPVALKTIYGHGANVEKSEFYVGFRAAPAATSTLLTIDKGAHARKRRILSQAFSDTAIKGVEPYVVDHVREFVDTVAGGTKLFNDDKNGWTPAKDMSKWTGYLGFDVLGDLLFAKSFGTLGEHPENRENIRLLGQAAKRNYVTAAMPPLHRTGAERFLPGFRTLYLDRLKYLAFGKRLVMERAKDTSFLESGRKDIFSYLLHAKDPETGEGLSKSELWMEGNTLIFAGSETTSTTLAAAFFYILHNADVLKRLTDEIREKFLAAEDIRGGAKLTSCSYLRACLDETLRMSPAVGGLLPRTILPGGLSVLDRNLPEGTDIGVPIYAIHHHADYVADPFTYDPTRWLPSEPKGLKQNREALYSVFNPFSVGPRGCIGKPLAYLELSLALARLIWAYDMRLARVDADPKPRRLCVEAGREHENEYQMKDCFGSANVGPWAEFRAREM